MIHLWDRLIEAKERLAPVQSQYRVVFENPMEPDAVSIMVPDPNWMAMALAGDILPSIDAYLEDRAKVEVFCQTHPAATFSWDQVGGCSHPYAPTVGPMTEEQAIEYLIMKDLPRAVWGDHQTANAPRFKIVRAEAISTNRDFRNAWKIAA